MIARDPRNFAKEIEAEKVKRGFSGVITHKCCAEKWEGRMALKHTEGRVPVLATFGALNELDGYGGRDIAVVGTPHINPIVYKLMGHVLGHDVGGDAMAFGERVVQRGGFEYSFNACSEDDGLVGLQLGLIEGELLQAAGRARLVNHDCVVHVYSNVPLEGGSMGRRDGITIEAWLIGLVVDSTVVRYL